MTDTPITWAAQRRRAAAATPPPGPPPPIPALPDSAAFDQLVTRIDAGDIDGATETGHQLLARLDAAALATWFAIRHGGADAHAVLPPLDASIAAATAVMQQAGFDGCIGTAEQEIDAWDPHLILRDRLLWHVSQWWSVLAARRCELEPARPADLAAAVHPAKPIVFPRTSRGTAAVGDVSNPIIGIAAAITSWHTPTMPTRITCTTGDQSWQAVLRLPPQPGGTIRVRVAWPDDRPIIETVTCCGIDLVLDADGCATMPWAVLSSLGADEEIWVTRADGSVARAVESA